MVDTCFVADDGSGESGSLVLATSVRWACAVVGTILLGAATVAVVFKGSDVGAAGLAASGLLLFMIGVGGRLPMRLKVGDNEINWPLRQELERARTDDVKEVFEAASRATTEITAAASPQGSGATDAPADGSSAAAVEDRIIQELESSAPAIAERLADVRGFEETVGEVLRFLASQHDWTVDTDTRVGFASRIS